MKKTCINPWRKAWERQRNEYTIKWDRIVKDPPRRIRPSGPPVLICGGILKGGTREIIDRAVAEIEAKRVVRKRKVV